MHDTVARRQRPSVRCSPASIVTAALLLAALLLAPGLALGCDLCAIYTTTEVREDRPGFRLGVGEQYTYFATLKNNGQTVDNVADERLRSSITQLVAGYHFHPLIGLQLNLPIITRSYRRLEPTAVVNGDETGIGDMSLIAIGKPFSYVDTERVAHLVLFGGLEFPTGDPSALAEEVPQASCTPFPDPNQCRRPRIRMPVDDRPRHGNGPPSGIHGHDLALGSGSVDGILGAQLFGSWKRLFATASLQYLARTVGAFDYQYANDLLWETGPGYYLALGDHLFGAPYAFGAQVLFTGETKGEDSIDGETLDDTALTALYLGPAFRFTWGVHLGAEIEAELPVMQNNTGLQILPDYRIRGGFSWRF